MTGDTAATAISNAKPVIKTLIVLFSSFHLLSADFTTDALVFA
jgi:hypothetical protein